MMCYVCFLGLSIPAFVLFVSGNEQDFTWVWCSAEHSLAREAVVPPVSLLC